MTHGNAITSSWADVRGFSLTNKAFGPMSVPDGSPYADENSRPLLTPDRPDGYGDSWVNVFQGVRVYDPTMAQWTAPDAYSGDAHDPMSQKPFMWNNNNPLVFQDPSGYDGFYDLPGYRRCPCGEPLPKDTHMMLRGTVTVGPLSAHISLIGGDRNGRGAAVSGNVSGALTVGRNANAKFSLITGSLTLGAMTTERGVTTTQLDQATPTASGAVSVFGGGIEATTAKDKGSYGGVGLFYPPLSARGSVSLDFGAAAKPASKAAPKPGTTKPR